MNLMNKCGPRICPSLFMFRPTILKQLNGLTAIDTFSCLDGLDVTHQTAERDYPGSIPGAGKDFYVCFFVIVILLLKHII